MLLRGKVEHANKSSNTRQSLPEPVAPYAIPAGGSAHMQPLYPERRLTVLEVMKSKITAVFYP